jgi:rod shape-determining protein MreB
MIGRAPSHITVVRPLRNGVIADLRLAQAMLDYFIRKAHNRGSWNRPIAPGPAKCILWSKQ